MTCDNGAITARRELRRYVRQFSESLGSNAAAVAATLAALQVHGIPKNPADCAMARCLRAIVGAETTIADIKVGVRSVQITRATGRRPVTVRFPKAVSKFICAFDNGCYHELVDPSHRVDTKNSLAA